MPVAVVTQLWLLGHGIQHSPSPAMQNAALRAVGLDWDYSIRDVSSEELAAVLWELRAGEALGCNVTIPHKRAVAEACDRLEGDAALIGAVNTVVVEDGALVGHNTDARGLELALQYEGVWPEPGAAVVVLGAGGAAAAASLALSRSHPARITVASRRPDAAAELVARLSSAGVPANFSSPAEAANLSSPAEAANCSSASWDPESIINALTAAGTSSLLLNATPATLADLPFDVESLPDGCTVVDLRYRPRPVDTVTAARLRGLHAADGLEMLLHQGMLSFALWTGVDPPTGVARMALREAVGA